MKKNYDIPDEVMDIILRIKKEKNYGSETQTVCQIIKAFDKREREKEKLDVLTEKINRVYQTEWKQLRNHVGWLDKNMEVLMELMNSMLIYQMAERNFLSTEIAMHPWMADAREVVKDRISHAKQIKDHRNRWNKKRSKGGNK